MKRKVLKDLFWAAFKFVFAIKNCGIILICVLKRKSVPFIANLVSLSLRKIPSYSVLCVPTNLSISHPFLCVANQNLLHGIVWISLTAV